MKHIKTFEQVRIKAETPQEIKYFEVEPEVIKIREFLRKVIKKTLSSSPEYVNYLDLEENQREERIGKWKIFSLVFNTMSNFFIFQFDYKKDGLWIKHDINSIQPKLKNEIKILDNVFDSVCKKKTEYGWNFENGVLAKELDNMDLYTTSNKYNL
jgi:hypothetical protein